MIQPDEADKQTTDVAPDGDAGGDPSSAPTGASGDASADDAEARAELTPEEQLAEVNDKWLRARAELDNVRRRARLDVEDARRYGATALLTELLAVVDSLQRALASAGEGADPQLIQGLQLTEQMFLNTLLNHGVVPVEAACGDAFDPTRHRAVVEQPSGSAEPGTILAEVVRGYQLRDRLLRESQVVVARAPDSAPEGAGDADV